MLKLAVVLVVVIISCSIALDLRPSENADPDYVPVVLWHGKLET